MDDDSKLSVDAMVEMAMGLSMASLFNQAMNSAFANSRQMQENPLNTPAKYLYAIINGKQEGPYSTGEVMALIKSGSITPETYMWKPGMPEWKPAREITDIIPATGSVPPAMPQENSL